MAMAILATLEPAAGYIPIAIALVIMALGYVFMDVPIVIMGKIRSGATN